MKKKYFKNNQHRLHLFNDYDFEYMEPRSLKKYKEVFTENQIGLRKLKRKERVTPVFKTAGIL